MKVDGICVKSHVAEKTKKTLETAIRDHIFSGLRYGQFSRGHINSHDYQNKKSTGIFFFEKEFTA